MIAALRTLWYRYGAFLRRQKRNFKIMLLRRALHALGVNLTNQYNSIYAVALGADPVQLGSVLSVGNAVAAAVTVPAGWLIDRYSLKKVTLSGTVLLLFSALCYALAPDWRLLYAGIGFLYMGVRITCTSCTVIGARELANEERATARGVCRTFSSLLTVLTPMLAAWLITLSGGINVGGIRPLYFIQLAIFGSILVLVLRFVREPQDREAAAGRGGLSDFTEIFRGRPLLIRVLAMLALMDIPWTMVRPYMPLFAHQYKGAAELQLAGLAVTISIAPLLFALPLGRLADRYGRKKLLFFIAPVSYLSSALLIGATGPLMLFLAGLCFGFNSIATALGAAMASEIVPKEQMGRWFGLIGLTRGLVSVPAPLLGGLIWEHAGPRYVFIFAVLLDAALRLPLLASIRETLDLGFSHKPGGKGAGSAVSAVSPKTSPGPPPVESPGPGWEDSCKMQ
jgi:MFS family permease